MEPVSPEPGPGPPARLRSLKLLNYDTDKFPFARLVSEFVLLTPDQCLSELHHSASSDHETQRLVNRWSHAVNWARNDKHAGRKNTRIPELFDRFVSEVVAPAMGTKRVYYQAKPSLRIQKPGEAGIRMHTDAEYHHMAGELNWWLPCTPTFG